MRKSLRILIGLGVAALILAVAMPSSFAQCPQAREFGAQGNGTLTARIKIATPVCPNDGNEFGGIWDATNSGINAGGPFFGTPDTCSISTGLDGGPWWLTGGKFLGANSGIQGFVASPTCIMTLCPGVTGQLMTVVEDVSPDGTDACVIAYLVDETPAAVRWYDHGRTIGGVPGTSGTQIMETFPTVDVTGSSGPPPGTTTTQDYRDVAINFHGALGSTAAPASAGIVSYDVVYFHGAGDPGRDRSLWTPLKSIPYTDAGVVGDTVAVPCPSETAITYMAVGLTYAGGVESVLVGKSTAVECDPNLAVPQEPAKRPKLQQRQPLGRGR